MAPRKPKVQDTDALRFDPNREGAPEPYVHRKYPHAARGKFVSEAFAATDLLGYPRESIRSTSDGFKLPENIDRYLFPSEYSE